MRLFITVLSAYMRVVRYLHRSTVPYGRVSRLVLYASVRCEKAKLPLVTSRSDLGDHPRVARFLYLAVQFPFPIPECTSPPHHI